ncbi:ArsR/SmtB family transcription factor [Miltoncostaea oceani]|uniref:ArsR/SmtB family transcription factor n=1 Tax=Miltoncostaea oceani TaxID=2843216 RepID=UPI001C3DAE4E|nr:metalloregulator ArsR/SmtB family transcription factor [Miltoncostaea oceani]
MTMNETGSASHEEPGVDLDETSGLPPAASLFNSLSDTTRLAIVRYLLLGEHRVVDLTAHLGLAQSTVSAHLACLRDCGLVTSRPQGRASLFRISPDAEPALRSVLTAAEQLLAVTGDAVDLCPTYGSQSRGDAR